MSSCAEYEISIDRACAEEADDAERERLLEHLDVCADCSQLFDLLCRLRGVPAEAEPPAEAFARMRQAVLAELPRRTRLLPVGERPAAFLLRRAAWPLAAAAVLALGVGLGLLRPARPSAAEPLAQQLHRVAARHNTLDESFDSPFVFSNLRAEPAGNGRVRLAFDVAQHLDTVVDRQDPLLAEVVSQTLVAPAPIAARMGALELASGSLDPRIRHALILAMRSDESLDVRLRAQAALARFPGDPEITQGMLAVLEREPAVQMRFLAIEFLARGGAPRGELERAIRTGRPEAEPAMLVHLRDALASKY